MGDGPVARIAWPQSLHAPIAGREIGEGPGRQSAVGRDGEGMGRALRIAAGLIWLFALASRAEAAPHIVWRLDNPFRLFDDAQLTDVHRIIYEGLQPAVAAAAGVRVGVAPPVADDIDTRPLSRIMYGRTISPMRKGMSRIAAKPIHETASTRLRGTSANERSKKRQRTARK